MARLIVRKLKDSVKRKLQQGAAFGRLARWHVSWMALVTLVATNTSQAQNADCDKILNSNVPYELRVQQELVRPERETNVVSRVCQIYRSESGTRTSYCKLDQSSTMKVLSYGPFLMEVSRAGQI